MTRQQERDRAKRRLAKQEQAMARRESDRGRRLRIGAILGVTVLVLGALALAGTRLGSDGDPPPATTLAGCALPPDLLGTGAELTLPDAAEVEGKTYVATVTTNCGDIELTLDGSAAPQAVASFLQLAQQNYWVDAPCHRLTTSETLKVLQCGDPTGTGAGTPGYGFGVENAPEDGFYPRGTLAMARTSDPDQGNGGQFFIVYGDSTLPDPDGYTVFGTVTGGLDIVDEIADIGVVPGGASPDDGIPAASISILAVDVTEKKA